jgi:hypothetical protein
MTASTMQVVVNVDVDDMEKAIEFWGHLAMMSDPFGHGFCVLQFSGNGYDEVARPC